PGRRHAGHFHERRRAGPDRARARGRRRAIAARSDRLGGDGKAPTHRVAPRRRVDGSPETAPAARVERSVRARAGALARGTRGLVAMTRVPIRRSTPGGPRATTRVAPTGRQGAPSGHVSLVGAGP